MQTSSESVCSGLKLSFLEEIKMDTLKKCYDKAKVDGALKFITDGFFLTPNHFNAESWLQRLNNSFLATGAQLLIKPICLCVLQRMQENENANHPYHILCYELLQWLTSNPESSEASLKDLQARQLSIKFMLSLLFVGKKREGDLTATMYKEDESTCLLLTMVQSKLNEDILPRLQREMVNTTNPKSASLSPPTQRSTAPICAQPPKLPPLSEPAPATIIANNNPAPAVTDTATTTTTLATSPRPISPRLRHFLTQPVKPSLDKASNERRLNIGSERVKIPASTEQDPGATNEPQAGLNML